MGLHYKQWASVEAANKTKQSKKSTRQQRNYNEAWFGPPVFYEYTEPSTWEAEEIEEP